MLSIALVVVFAMAVEVQAQRPGRNGQRGAAAAGKKAPARQAPNPADKQAALEYVFGDKAKLDPAKVSEVLASGKKLGAEDPAPRFYYDTNNDGQPDEVWFLDNDSRHSAARKPIIVKAVPKYPIKKGDEPNKANSTFYADWKADGMLDAVIDYEDVDGDGGLDRMGMYTGSAYNGGMVLCWYSQNYGATEKEVGKDHLLWYDVNYAYDQNRCQTRTHFNGNEGFVELRIKPGEPRWTAFFENPFEFYDRDGDGVTEEVIRLVADDGLVRSLRWSFDAANAGTKDNPRAYDVSISAEGPGWTQKVDPSRTGPAFTLRIPQEYARPEWTVQGRPVGIMLDRDRAAEWLGSVTYPAAMLTWVEDGNNVAPVPAVQKAAGERWEGVLNEAYKGRDGQVIFPAVGGPSSGPVNRRFEYINAPKGPFEYYFSPADKRIHLKDQSTAWMDVDYNFDGKNDMRYEWFDTDSNGIVDRVQIDVNGDGETEDYWKLDEGGVKPVKWNFQEVNGAFGPVVNDEPARLYALNQALATALNNIKPGSGKDEVWSFIEAKFLSPITTETLSRKLLARDESMMFFMRLAADRRLCALQEQANAANKTAFVEKLVAARVTGDTDAMTRLIRKQYCNPVQKFAGLFAAPAPKAYAKWRAQLQKEPQVQAVAWDDTWLPPNVGWESLNGETGYRMYYGHWDCFGKTRPVLLYPIITSPNRGGGGSYHEQQNWGMDCLHIGNTCGCGGLMLWINGKNYPVYKPDVPEAPKMNPIFTWHKGKDGKIEPIEYTKTKVTLECVVTNVGPADNPYTVIFRPTALAGRPDSPIEVQIKGGKKGDKVEVGIGLRKITSSTFAIDETAGVMGYRGFQDGSIGWIGIGVVYPVARFNRLEQLPGETYAIMNYQVGQKFTYSIRSDWVAGHQYPIFPNLEDWMDKLRETAKITQY
ncbi:MAG: DUF4861 family protein [Candidatus Sumerlaeia bacterium]